eukprot:1607806-Pleurochrysis_carterae.AAC.5
MQRVDPCAPPPRLRRHCSAIAVTPVARSGATPGACQQNPSCRPPRRHRIFCIPIRTGDVPVSRMSHIVSEWAVQMSICYSLAIMVC